VLNDIVGFSQLNIHENAESVAGSFYLLRCF